MRKRRPVLPGLVLFFLSPVVAELLTSSSPPVLFFTPFGLIIMTALYGSGALIARELTVRWKKGWPTLITLGTAYGIAEEGLMVKSFFDPDWPGIGFLGSYGRLWGVNWVWSLELTIFHSLFSIVIPIVLVGILFPKTRDKRFMGPVGLPVFCCVLVADVILGGIGITKYVPPVIPLILGIAACAGLVVLARFLPESVFPAARPPAGSAAPLPFFILGLCATTLFFVLHWVVPGLPVPPVVTIFLVLAVVAGLFIGVWRLRSPLGLSDKSQWALCAGALAFFIVLSPFVQMDGSRKNVQGMVFVGLGMAVFLGMVFVLVWRRQRKNVL